PGVRSTLVDDVYVILVNWEGITAESTPFKLYHNPLVKWVWIGGYVFILGIVVAAWVDDDEEDADKKPHRTRRKRATVQ
ncbi:MAG: hypothetical protein HOG15_01525, partial [Anaerolineae bacterium]|nr:hypothetical protein [Anaerolineae bacterium]